VTAPPLEAVLAISLLLPSGLVLRSDADPVSRSLQPAQQIHYFTCHLHAASFILVRNLVCSMRGIT